MSTRPIRLWQQQGVCTNCGAERDTTEYVRCKRCRDQVRKRQSSGLPNGACRRCRKGRAVEGRSLCEKCLGYLRKTNARRWSIRAQRHAIARAAEAFVQASRMVQAVRESERGSPEAADKARRRATFALHALFRAVDELTAKRDSAASNERRKRKREAA